MFEGLKQIIYQIVAVTEKELRLRTRFPLDFFFNIFMVSIKSLIPVLFIIAGLFGTQTPNFYSFFYFFNSEKNLLYYYLLFKYIDTNFYGSFNQINYVSWLLIGSIIFTFSQHGFDTFEARFGREKYWNTVQGMILSPINRFYILIGYIITSLIESVFFFLFFIIICFLSYPVAIFQIIQVFLIAFIMIIASGGIGLIVGSIFLANENFTSVFSFLQFVVLFFSCFSIPIKFLPSIFQDIAKLNPYYYGTELARNLYYGIYDINWLFSLVYIIIFAIIASYLGVYAFNKIWSKYGIQGY